MWALLRASTLPSRLYRPLGLETSIAATFASSMRWCRCASTLTASTLCNFPRYHMFVSSTPLNYAVQVFFILPGLAVFAAWLNLAVEAWDSALAASLTALTNLFYP